MPSLYLVVTRLPCLPSGKPDRLEMRRLATQLAEQLLAGGEISGDQISGAPISGDQISGAPISGDQISGAPISGAVAAAGEGANP